MMIHPIIRPALPMVVLIVIGGWMLAGLAITATSLLGWPPVASLVLHAPGWTAVVIGIGVLLTVGGGLVLASVSPRLRLSTRWRLETSGEWLLVGAWIAYAVLSATSASVAVVLISASHALAALWRIREIANEEHVTRAIVERGQA